MGLFGKLKAMRMLLIDDDELIRDSLRLYFATEGCDLTALESAEQGLKALSRQEYDILIVDYKLPGINGFKFLEQIQATHPNVLKIFVSAFGDDEVLGRVKKLGIEEFIEKPFTSKTIENALLRLIGKREEQLDGQ